MSSAGRRRWLACAAFTGMCVLGSPGFAEEPRPDERIAALIADGHSGQAIPLARQVARARDDAESWQLVLQLANWNSRAEAAIEALSALVRLEPEVEDLRVKLAQRLLWAKKTSAALPHANWLLDKRDNLDATAFEICTWVLLEQGQRDGALAAARGWLAADPESMSARWVIADLTHWSYRWREARAQYRVLGRHDEHADKARARVSMLRHAHPNDIRSQFVWWSDNVGVTYRQEQLSATVQLPKQLALRTDVALNHWHQVIADDHSQLGVGSVKGSLLIEAGNLIQPELTLGAQMAPAGAVPEAEVKLRISHGGWLFGHASAGYGLMGASLTAIASDIRTWRSKLSLYAQPKKWLFVSGEAGVHLTSDDNERRQGVLALGVHNTGSLQLQPRLFAQFDGFRYLRSAVESYYTPTVPLSTGGDLTVRYRRGERLHIEASLGVIKQADVVAVRPGGLIRFLLADRLKGQISFASIGSPQYSQNRVDATLGYVF